MPASVTTDAEATAPALNHDLASALGWRAVERDGARLWFAGYLFGSSAERALAALPAKLDLDALARWAAGLDGHFALLAMRPGWAVAAVDRVRSIPLFLARVGDGWRLGAHADALRRRAGLGSAEIDPEAALQVAMAGYTIDRATLYRGLVQLGPGELALCHAGRVPERRRYYTYRPWRVRLETQERLARDLAESIRRVFDKTAASLAGRAVAVPLSAGLDSRLVLCGLKQAGCRDLRAFSYGLAGNFEAETARRVAEALGVPWRFMPLSARSQRAHFASADFRAYLDYADSCAATPFPQDLPVLRALLADGFLPADTVVVNGNSGDYISGNHLPANLHDPACELDEERRRARIIDALIDKHFALWTALMSDTSRVRIGAALAESLAAAGAEIGDADTDHGLYEYAEFQDRQCKYVIAGQRVYEHAGLDWRLPLWDRDVLDFWEGVPIAFKAGQRLYRETLSALDWGGVWRGVPVNRRTVRPAWLAPIRLAAKAAHAPLGRARWREAERRWFAWWMDNLGNYGLVPYRRVVADRRGHRNAISWHTEAYLNRHGLAWDGTPLV